MFNLSGSEIVVILLLALVVLGPEKLPDALRRAGRTYAELKKMGNSFQAEVKSALDEPMKEMRETADLLRNAADFADEPATTSTPAATIPSSTTTPTPAADADDDDVDEDLINRTLSGGAPVAGDSGAGETESSAPLAADETPTT